MSMRELADPGDGAWLEAEIERELAQLSPVDSNDLGLEDGEDGDDLDQEEDFQENNDSDDDVPESLAVYLERVQSRAGLVEEGLKECEDVMHHTVTHADPGAVVPFTSTDLLDQLAASTGQNPAELKRRVLEEIEAEEQDDEDEMGMLDENSNGVEDEEEQEEDGGGGQAGAATGADTGETVGADSPQNGETGAVVLYGVDDLERQLTLQLRRFHQEQQAQQRQLEEQLQRRRQEEDSWRREQEQRSKQRDADFHKQQEQLEKHKQEEQAKLDTQLQEEERRKGELLRQQEQQIQQLSQQTAEEKAAFYKQLEEEKKRLETQKQKSAAKIQAAFKSYKVRKIHGPVLKEKRENRKKSWALNRQLEIEKHKKEEELKQRLDEQERKRKEDEKRKEEERKKEEEEERRRKEQEEKERIEEERKRKEEEKKRMEEEAKRKQEEEERRKREEEERRRQEEEKRKQEEKKREEERLRLEEERKKKEEAERKEKEEQLRRKQEEEEKRKLEEERIKLVEQEKRRREEEQKRMEEEAKMRKEAEEKLKTIENVETNNLEQVKDNSLVERTVLTQEDMTAISDDIERRRLQWMESCRPWSQVSAELKRRKPKKGGRGAAKHASAKNLPELTDEQLLKVSKPGTPLDKVEEVNIAGLTGCSLSRLSECPGLLSITVNQCEAQVLYGVQRFTSLQHINVSQNRLTVLVCSGCTSLNRLMTAHNQLSSIQGLDGCNDLQVLDLSHNKITRIGGLDSCVHLQHLNLSHNQLISLRGLQLVPTLLHLDVSHNHLPAAEHLQDCGLLQHLNLASNTLTKPPSLDNHVLLRSLVLDDNSISSLDVLSTAWLPLLSLLSVKQNSLTQVSSLCHLMLLEHLDVSCNQLEDVPGVAGGVSACGRLHTLNVAGNPLTEDQSYRSDLVAAIPSLCQLDGEEIQQRSSTPRATVLPFVRMCLAQQTQWNNMSHRHEEKLKEAEESGDVRSCLAVQHAHREECYQLAVEHRYAHEYGEMDSSGETDSSGAAISGKDTGVKETTDNEKTQLDKVPPVANVTADSRTQSVTPVGRTMTKEDSTQDQGASTSRKVVTTSGRGTSTGASYTPQESSGALKSVAAVRIQSVWRGYSVRRDIRQHTQEWLEANTIKEAATKIQAAWRGHRLRLRLKRALQAARWEDDDDIDDDDDEFGEVDLSSFDMQAAELDQAWAPPQTPTLPTRHAVLGSVSSQHQDRTQPVWDTRQAWQGAPTPPPPSPKHPLPPVKPPSRASSASSQHHPTPPTSRLGSVISTKSEQLTEEWGFKSGTTAELMMKRARRMKARKKKTLDPHQRLALQRKLAEKEAPPTVRAPPRRQPNRVDYFRAKEAMHQFLDSAETEPESVQEAQRQKMTYTWVHSQVGHLDNTPEAPEHDRFIRRTGSTGTLPRLDPDIIATGRVQLVRTPPAAQMDGLELESVDGTSASDLQSHRERRHSIEGDSPRETQFEPSPPKTNSAPSQKLRERLSRHSDADKNAAWGSGRRRIQLFKM